MAENGPRAGGRLCFLSALIVFPVLKCKRAVSFTISPSKQLPVPMEYLSVGLDAVLVPGIELRLVGCVCQFAASVLVCSGTPFLFDRSHSFVLYC
jgi:hypothetical protein